MRQADALEPQRLNTRGVAGGCRRRDLAEDVGLLLEERVETSTGQEGTSHNPYLR